MSQLWPNHISYWRKRAGMSQDDLAAAIDPPTTKGTISQYESGKREPSQKRLIAIAEALGRSAGELLDGPQDAAPDRPEGAMPVTAIPHLGEVPAGPWQDAVRKSHHFIPAPEPGMPASAYALTVTGGSMDRLVRDGATIIVDPEDHDAYDKGLYVVRNPDGEFTFKQYRDNPARLVPCSSDPSHKTIPITDRRFEVVGAVIKIIYDPHQAAIALD
ncbi:helix-turn-helix domain-containing protein [Sphingobium fuliginis]|nr:XRE family transcriptional regulator [Sphingobium fuliginis]